MPVGRCGRKSGGEGAISNSRTVRRQRAAARKRRSRPWRGLPLRACILCGAATVSSGFVVIPAAIAQQQPATVRDTFGEVGILDMPSGHMAPDGQFSFSLGDIGNYQRYSLAFQALPWFEGSFRYSRVPYWFGSKVYWDRSFGMKARLFREDGLVPDVSIGIRDLLGTGVYSSEYLVASKHIGSFDFTAGLGWGRLASNGTLPNPFGYLLKSFDTRTPSSATGIVDFKQFFHGPRAGVFGGLQWQTPIDGLQLLAEYSSDKYTYEGYYAQGMHARAPVNVGLSYRPSDTVALTAGWFYGTTYGFTISLSGDPTTEASSALRIGPPVPSAIVRDEGEQQHAVSLMMNRNAYVATEKAGGPWIRVPTETERAKLDLKQALLSESHGVRGIDIEGTTLLIDADRGASAQTQCAQYAQIASAVGTRSTSVAMTDLQKGDGQVTFCPVAVQAVYSQNDAQAGSGSFMAAAGNIDQKAVERRLRADMDKQSLYLEALSVGSNELWVYYDQGHYWAESEAAGRLARLLMADAPPSIEVFHLIPALAGVPAQEITILRSALERVTSAHGAASDIGGAITLTAPPLDNPALDQGVKSFFPYTYWALDPKLTEHVFDPDKPLQFMVYADATAGLVLAPGFGIYTDLTANIWNDYTLTRPADSVLPHVRTDLLQYIKHGGNYGISSLELNYQTRLARDVFAEVKAGYLEDMFMGAGGDVLWRPENSRFTFGADIYQVWKRDFNRLFGIQNYNILTGHVSVYYQSPWYGLNFKVHAGRYLAGDYGATFEITRRFASGVEIGAFATLTNVPFSQFGEGSFDKGLVIRIPFEWGLPVYSQSSYDLRLSALTRDGGQRLDDDDSLYETTNRTSYGEIVQNFDDLVEP